MDLLCSFFCLELTNKQTNIKEEEASDKKVSRGYLRREGFADIFGCCWWWIQRDYGRDYKWRDYSARELPQFGRCVCANHRGPSVSAGGVINRCKTNSNKINLSNRQQQSMMIELNGWEVEMEKGLIYIYQPHQNRSRRTTKETTNKIEGPPHKVGVVKVGTFRT